MMTIGSKLLMLIYSNLLKVYKPQKYKLTKLSASQTTNIWTFEINHPYYHYISNIINLKQYKMCSNVTHVICFTCGIHYYPLQYFLRL